MLIVIVIVATVELLSKDSHVDSYGDTDGLLLLSVVLTIVVVEGAFYATLLSCYISMQYSYSDPLAKLF